MGRELEEGLIRTHHSEELQKKKKEGPQFVNSRILPERVQGLENQIKQKLQPSEGRYRILDQEIKSFSPV